MDGTITEKGILAQLSHHFLVLGWRKVGEHPTVGHSCRRCSEVLRKKEAGGAMDLDMILTKVLTLLTGFTVLDLVDFLQI